MSLYESMNLWFWVLLHLLLAFGTFFPLGDLNCSMFFFSDIDSVSYILISNSWNLVFMQKKARGYLLLSVAALPIFLSVLLREGQPLSFSWVWRMQAWCHRFRSFLGLSGVWFSVSVSCLVLPLLFYLPLLFVSSVFLPYQPIHLHFFSNPL